MTRRESESVLAREHHIHAEALAAGYARQAEKRATAEMLARLRWHWDREFQRRRVVMLDAAHEEAIVMDDVVFPGRVLRFVGGAR